MKADVGTWACTLSLDQLIPDCLCLAHVVEIRINSLSVLFRDGNSSLYFSRKLFEFKAYVNSLNHLDCSLEVFYIKKFISGSNFFSHHWRQLLELELVLFLLTSWIPDCLYFAHTVEIRINSLSVFFLDGSSSS